MKAELAISFPQMTSVCLMFFFLCYGVLPFILFDQGTQFHIPESGLSAWQWVQVNLLSSILSCDHQTCDVVVIALRLTVIDYSVTCRNISELSLICNQDVEWGKAPKSPPRPLHWVTWLFSPRRRINTEERGQRPQATGKDGKKKIDLHMDSSYLKSSLVPSEVKLGCATKRCKNRVFIGWKQKKERKVTLHSGNSWFKKIIAIEIVVRKNGVM